MRVDEDVVGQLAGAAVGGEVGDSGVAEHLDVEERVPGALGGRSLEDRHGGVSHDLR